MEKLRAIELRKGGLSIKQIAQKLGVSKGSVSPWVKSVTVSKENKKKILERMLRGGEKGRKKIIQKWKEYRKVHPMPPLYVKPIRSIDTFFDSWTPEMAYVLGYFAADGCMYRNPRGSYYVAFCSTDRDLLETVKKIMEVNNEIEVYKLSNPRCKLRYTLQIGSKSAFERLTKYGFTPKKSLVVKLPDIPDELFCHFLRGNLDGDGCVFLSYYVKKGRERKSKVFRVSFTSGSRVFLEAMHNKLTKMKIIDGGCIHRKSSGHFELVFSSKDAGLLYNFMYPSEEVPCLKRKKDVFIKALTKMDP